MALRLAVEGPDDWGVYVDHQFDRKSSLGPIWLTRHGEPTSLNAAEAHRSLALRGLNVHIKGIQRMYATGYPALCLRKQYASHPREQSGETSSPIPINLYRLILVIYTPLSAWKGFVRCILPVVEAFIKGDRSLILQSSDEGGFYISYGYRHVCRLSIDTRGNDSIFIAMYADSLFEVYSGGFKKNTIENAVKEALLRWYSGIFRI